MQQIKISFALLFFIIVQTALPQSSGSLGVTDARSMGMAKTYTSSSFGLYALGKNPANLFQDSSKHLELILPILIPNIAVNVGTNFITLNEYNYFFGQKNTDAAGNTTGRQLTEDDKTRLKNLFADGGSFFSDANVQLFGVLIKFSNSFGVLAFTISDAVAANITFPKGIIDLGIDGNLLNKVYNFSDTKLKAWWLRKYSFSYARDLKFFKGFTIGISVNMVQGFFYTGIDRINTELVTGDANAISGRGDYLAYAAFSPDFNVKYDFDKSTTKKDFAFSPFPTPAGKGIGYDLGFNAKVSEVFSFGFAITDIGKIKWDKNVAEYSTNALIYIDDLTNQDQLDSLIKNLTGKDSGHYINSITTDLATALHFGFSLKFNKLLLAFDFNQGFNEQPRNSKKPRYSFGADWSPGFFAFRTGVSFGGYDKFNWGLGIGFDFGFLEINVGSPDFQYAVSPNSAKRISVAVDSRWKF